MSAFVQFYCNHVLERISMRENSNLQLLLTVVDISHRSEKTCSLSISFKLFNLKLYLFVDRLVNIKWVGAFWRTAEWRRVWQGCWSWFQISVNKEIWHLLHRGDLNASQDDLFRYFWHYNSTVIKQWEKKISSDKHKISLSQMKLISKTLICTLPGNRWAHSTSSFSLGTLSTHPGGTRPCCVSEWIHQEAALSHSRVTWKMNMLQHMRKRPSFNK